MPRAEFSLAECCRVLGVAPGVPWEQVRQAYLDLVRVWHPDRFQSNPDLRRRAEQQLQKINEAYLALKNAQSPHCHQQSPFDQEPEDFASTVSVRSPLYRTLSAFLCGLRLYRPVCVLAFGVLCLIPAAFVWRALSLLTLAELDSSLINGRLRRPAILTPSRIVNPFADVSVNSDLLTAWARGDGVDLWRSVPAIGEKSPEFTAESVRKDARIQPGNLIQPDAHRRSGAAAPLFEPENGSEILWTRQSSGLGELWVTNETNLDAVATLVQATGTERVRAIYVQAKNKVCIRNIKGGAYDLVAEIGRTWDSKTLRFRDERHSLATSGPFDFFDVTSAEGRFGCRYDVVLRRR